MKFSIKKCLWQALTNFVRDLRSLRASWNWIFLVLFVVMSVYVLLMNSEAHGTLMTVWGGVISIVFTNYVTSTTIERIKDKALKHNNKKQEKIAMGGVEDEE